MEIYVVKAGDTIDTIADEFGVSVNQIIQENGLLNPFNLIPGQVIVITNPLQTHIVQEGDILESIADYYGVTVMQLLRLNPFLHERENIYPGETLTISHNADREIVTVGYAYPFIKEETLRRTLPNLTYLSVYNYRATDEGEIISYDDDTEIIRIAKEYDTVPLVLMTTLTDQGEPDLVVSYNMLLSEEYQDKQLDNLLNIIKEKGYLGANFVFNLINRTIVNLYINFTQKVSNRLKEEGYLTFVTINPGITTEGDEVKFEQADYSGISQIADYTIFLQFIWGVNYGQPAPVSSIYELHSFVSYAAAMVPPEKFIIGKPVIAYDWTLPFSRRMRGASALTTDAALALASDYNAVIYLDERSMTPYFQYVQSGLGSPIEHIVWSIDARSIVALVDLIREYELKGSGIWNIMVYIQQLWTIINANFDIIKAYPEDIE